MDIIAIVVFICMVVNAFAPKSWGRRRGWGRKGRRRNPRGSVTTLRTRGALPVKIYKYW